MAVGLALLGIGAALSIAGNIRGGILAKQGKILDDEAELLADLTLKLQSQDDAVLAQQQEHRRSAMAAEFGASGLAPEGSALEVVLAQSRLDVMNRSRQQFLAEMRARGLNFSGEQAKQGGKNQLFQSILASFGTAVSAGSSATAGTQQQLIQTS